jgi:TolB-like protein/DNA-binding winged helix-turn-helix (wHTH) protein/cytochrome c-type biogenesis protein CcmH/NrfG
LLGNLGSEMTLPGVICFDGWVLRTDSGELTREGTVVRLQDQPLQVLLALLDQPGVMVPREQLITRLWPKGVVDYEAGLNTVVRKLRAALGDDPGEPRYIETIPRRGYRFIGTIEVPEVLARATGPQTPAPEVGPAPMPPAASISEPVAAVSTAPTPHARRWRSWAWLLAVLVPVGLVLGTWSLRQQQAHVAESIAVLPFRPLLPEAADPALELGMADTLIMQLSRIPGLRVTPLTAARPFDTPGRDPLAAGRALGVDAVLEGSLQVDQQRLRVSARLLRVADGHALWSGNFDEPMASLFELQDAVARKVVLALAVQLSAEQAQRVSRPATRSMAAYQHYVNGLYLWQRRAPEAAAQFEAALREDPQYAQAWSGLAGALAAQAVYGYAPPQAVFPRAKQAALRAIELDPALAQARGALAHVLVQYERRYWEGEQEYLRVLSLEPSDANTWMRLALVRAMLGRLDEALADMTHARDLEPMNLAYATNVGLILYLKRDYAAAVRELNRVLELDPAADQARALLGRVLLVQGDTAGAIREFQRQRRSVPGGDGDLGRAYAHAGRVEEAKAEIERLQLRAKEGYGVAYDIAGIHAGLGDVASACESLQRAVDDHSQLLGFLASDPAMDPLRGASCLGKVQQRLLGSAPARNGDASRQ